MKFLKAAVTACAICSAAGAGYAQEGTSGGAGGTKGNGPTVFSSLSQALDAARGRGMVLARDLFGNMRFVSSTLAVRLEQQGFRKDRRGVLLGYAPGTSGQGLVFVASSPTLARDSYTISIEPLKDDDLYVPTGDDTGGSCGDCD